MFKKLRLIIHTQLTQGVTPHQLALTLALGIGFGLFPLLGFTTPLCLIAALVFRLNQPFIQFINYLLTPVHLIMIPIFLRIGEYIIGAEPISFSVTVMLNDLKEGPALFMEKYGMAAAYGILAWTLIAPVLSFMIYVISKPMFIRIRDRLAKKIKL